MKNIKLKIVSIVVLALVLFILTGLPSISYLGVDKNLVSGYQKLKNYDPIAKADRAASKGEYYKSLVLYELAIDGNLDRDKAETAMKNCLKKMNTLSPLRAELEQSGHLMDDQLTWNTLKDTSVASFFSSISGTDLVEELSKGGVKSTFSENVGRLEPLHNIFPECYDLIDLLAVCDHLDLLKPSYKNMLIKKIINIKYDREDTAALKDLFQELVALWELAKQSEKWSEFALIIPNIEYRKQLTMILQLNSKSHQALSKLERVLAVCDDSPNLKVAALSYINQNGIEGLDNADIAIQKGTDGIRFVTKNPKFNIASYLNKVNATTGINSWWLKNVALKYQVMADIFRYVLMSLIVSVIVIGLIPATSANAEISSVTTKLSFHVIWVVAAIFAVLFVLSYIVPSSGGNPVSTTGTAISGSGGATVGGARFTAMSFFALVVIILVQAGAYMKALSEMRKVKEIEGSHDEKIKQVENVDIFFDLPLYLGLLGTVSSFIMMVFSPTVSQIVAYSSTIIGIIMSALLRIFHLYPYRKELITLTVRKQPEGEDE